MKATILLVTSQKKTSKGFPIVLELFYTQKIRPRKTIGRTHLKYWNAESQVVLTGHPDKAQLNADLYFYKELVNKVNSSFNDYTFAEAKELLFKSKIKNGFDVGFIKFFDVRIEEKTALKESEATCKNYSDIKNLIVEFVGDDDIPFSMITYEWVNDFILYKYSKGTKAGGVMSYLKIMSAVFNEAKRRTSFKIKHENPFTPHIKIPTPKAVIDVSPKQLGLLKEFQPSKFANKVGKLNDMRALALWYFQIYIGGHDYIDLAVLKWEQIKDGRLVFKRHKNRNKKNGGATVSVFLFPEALEVINKYGTKDSERIFDFIPNPSLDYKKYDFYRQNINRTLRKISKAVNLNAIIKSKSPRYIFRTHAGGLLIHDLLVTKIQGHKPRGITYNYQGEISNTTIDEAHKKILDHILMREIEKAPEKSAENVNDKEAIYKKIISELQALLNEK